MHATRLFTVLWVPFLFSATANSLEAQTAITHVPLYTVHGEVRTLSGVGDVNGDGRPDLIVGAPNDGFARVYSGIDGSVLYNFDGDDTRDATGRLIGRFGSSVSGAGDINGDGIDDFIVGASGSFPFTVGYFRVFVSQTILLGDCNQDGVVNFRDIIPFILILASDDYLAEADTNEDGVVNFPDIRLFIVYLSL